MTEALRDEFQRLWDQRESEMYTSLVGSFARSCIKLEEDLRIDWNLWKSGFAWVDSTIVDGKMSRQIWNVQYNPPRNRAVEEDVLAKFPAVRVANGSGQTPEEAFYRGLFGTTGREDDFDIAHMRCQALRRMAQLLMTTQQEDNPKSGACREHFVSFAYECLVMKGETEVSWSALAECIGISICALAVADPLEEEADGPFVRRPLPYATSKLVSNVFSPGTEDDPKRFSLRAYLVEVSQGRQWSLYVPMFDLKRQPKRIQQYSALFQVWKEDEAPIGNFGSEVKSITAFRCTEDPADVKLFWNAYNK
jgi:hypothetical protein